MCRPGVGRSVGAELSNGLSVVCIERTTTLVEVGVLKGRAGSPGAVEGSKSVHCSRCVCISVCAMYIGRPSQQCGYGRMGKVAKGSHMGWLCSAAMWIRVHGQGSRRHTLAKRGEVGKQSVAQKEASRWHSW